MISKPDQLKILERKVIGSRRSNTFANALRISGEYELEYLMSGHATELIDAVSLPRAFDSNEEAKIFGAVAKDRSKGRYLWIYLYHGHHLWKCYNLQKAFEQIQKIRKHCEMEKKVYHLRYHPSVRANKKLLCNN